MVFAVVMLLLPFFYPVIFHCCHAPPLELMASEMYMYTKVAKKGIL